MDGLESVLSETERVDDCRLKNGVTTVCKTKLSLDKLMHSLFNSFAIAFDLYLIYKVDLGVRAGKQGRD